jgi:hypothetical protein
MENKMNISYYLLLLAVFSLSFDLSANTAFKCFNNKGMAVVSKKPCMKHFKKRYAAPPTAVIPGRPYQKLNKKRPYINKAKPPVKHNLPHLLADKKKLRALKIEKQSIIADLKKDTLPPNKTRKKLNKRLQTINMQIRNLQAKLNKFR